MLRTLSLPLLLAALTLAADAQAHIEIRPSEAPAGERVTIRFDVENESDSAGTRKVEVKLPRGISSVSPKSVRGWRTRLRRSGSEIERLIFTAPAGKEIPAGHTHRKFAFVIATPAGAGTTLAFKALQTYEDGTIQRWIGPPDSEEPAPTLRLTASRAGDRSAAQDNRSSEPPPAASGDPTDDDGGGGGVLIAIVAVGAVTAATAGFLWARRRRAAP